MGPGFFFLAKKTEDEIKSTNKRLAQIINFLPDATFVIQGNRSRQRAGLASVYGIINHHQGFIEVSSEPGQNSTFDLFLTASFLEHEGSTMDADQSDLVNPAGETVLLVDDEDMILELTEDLLTRSGYQVLTARGGHQAIEVFRKHGHEIDIVLLDMIMPDMIGAETYERLKDLDPGVKVILTSGYSLNSQTDKIFSQGCNGFLQKPFSIQSLVHKITEVLQQT